MRDEAILRLEALIAQIEKGDTPPLEAADELVDLALDIAEDQGFARTASIIRGMWEKASQAMWEELS